MIQGTFHVDYAAKIRSELPVTIIEKFSKKLTDKVANHPNSKQLSIRLLCRVLWHNALWAGGQTRSILDTFQFFPSLDQKTLSTLAKGCDTLLLKLLHDHTLKRVFGTVGKYRWKKAWEKLTRSVIIWLHFIIQLAWRPIIRWIHSKKRFSMFFNFFKVF